MQWFILISLILTIIYLMYFIVTVACSDDHKVTKMQIMFLIFFMCLLAVDFAEVLTEIVFK